MQLDRKPPNQGCYNIVIGIGIGFISDSSYQIYWVLGIKGRFS